MNSFRLFVGIVCAVLAAFVIIHAPTYYAYYVEVVATEWGHYVALCALAMAFLPGGEASTKKTAGILLCLAAAGVAMMPTVKAYRMRDAVAAQVREAYGDVTPREGPDAPPREQPLDPRALFMLATGPSVNHSERVYTKAGDRNLEMFVTSRVAQNERAPGILIVPGGSWQSVDPALFGSFSDYFAARGYVVAAIAYRTAPKDPWPAARDDVRAALNYMRNMSNTMGLDPGKIAILGRSAGAQLALIAAYSDGGVRGVVAMYGPTDLEWAWQNPGNPRVLDSQAVLSTYLGGGPDTMPGNYRDASPINWVSRSGTPTLLVHGLRDELVNYEHSRRLSARLDELHRPHVLLSLPWATHTCDFNINGPCGQLSSYAIERFLASVMR